MFFLPKISLNNLGGGILPQNNFDSLPVIKELEVKSPFLISLNENSFVYADQTDYITVAGNKNTDFQIGTETGDNIQAIYTTLESTAKSDGLVNQNSAHAKELEKFCVNWAKNFNNCAYTVNANHAELIGDQASQTFMQEVAPALIKILGMPRVYSNPEN